MNTKNNEDNISIIIFINILLSNMGNTSATALIRIELP